MTVESSLAFVLGLTLGEGHRKNFDKWNSTRVGSDRPLAQLHAKFWGKSMADEEEEWRNTQPPSSTGSLEHGGQDGDDNMDEGMDRGMDEGDESDQDDDVIRGCYMLNISIEGLEISRMWIRAEYIRIFDFVEDFFNEPGVPPGIAPSAVITGQPGIGKNVWIYYALRRYLAEKKPVIWYRRQACYLFVDEGVYQAPPGYSDYGFTIFVPTLVDSDESGSGVPEFLVPHETKHAVIYTTSPRKERWGRLHKTVRVIHVVMNPWVRKEILRAAQGLYPGMEEECINDAFDRLGPTPRLCINYSWNSTLLNIYENEVKDAISDLTIRQLERLFKDSRSLNMNSFSHKICLISRGSSLSAANIVVAPMTRFIQSRLASQFRRVAQAEQIRLYNTFAKVPESRGLAGILFEAAGQGQLQDGITLDIVPMVRLSKSRKGSLPQWYSSHLSISNKSLEQSRQLALQQQFRIDIPKPQIIEYGDGGPSSITPGALYLPELTNQVALDPFMLFDNFLYIFQFAVSKNHDIKPGLVTCLGKCSGLPPMVCWRFVLLMEPGRCLMCAQPRSLDLRELHPFSAVISL